MKNSVNMAVIGLGGRGLGLLTDCLIKMDDVNIVALCDCYQDRIDVAVKRVEKAKGNKPLQSVNYQDVIKLKEVDCVFITTAWEDHIKIAIESMRLGKFVATEVGGAYNIQDCYDLVKAYEETKVHCMMLENCCYGEYELLTLNMVKKGLFGDIVHCEGGYCHDLRVEIANGNKNRHYRLRNYINRNCENYPTHEIAPIGKILKINDGNKFESLYSVSSNAKGMSTFIKNDAKKYSELVNVEFKQGDIVTTVLKCHNGETVTIFLDTTLPRTYSRRYTIRGTRGGYFEETNSIFIDSKHHHSASPKKYWNNAKKFLKNHSHKLWGKENKKFRKAGHGGMDWFVIRALVETIKNDTYPPIDAYDTATYMSITALSEESIKNNCEVKFPDFTNGKWKKNEENILELYDLRY